MKQEVEQTGYKVPLQYTLETWSKWIGPISHCAWAKPHRCMLSQFMHPDTFDSMFNLLTVHPHLPLPCHLLTFQTASNMEHSCLPMCMNYLKTTNKLTAPSLFWRELKDYSRLRHYLSVSGNRVQRVQSGHGKMTVHTETTSSEIPWQHKKASASPSHLFIHLYPFHLSGVFVLCRCGAVTSE